MLSVGVQTLISDTLAMATSGLFFPDQENVITLFKNSKNGRRSTKYSIRMNPVDASCYDKIDNSILQISI